MSIPSVIARGVCTCERLRVIRTAAIDMESATPKKSAPKRRNAQKERAEAVEHRERRLPISARRSVGNACKRATKHDKREQHFEHPFEAPEDAKPHKYAKKVPTQIFVPSRDQAEDNDKERRSDGDERV